MRKSLGLLILLLAAGAPSAYADSFDASFTCTGSCVAIPTDPFVNFPSPTVPISFFSLSFNISLNAQDSPNDTFTWDVAVTSTNWDFVINDLTTGWSNDGPWFQLNLTGGTPYGCGSVYFNPTPAPEPGASALMLLGVGLVLVVRKRLSLRIPQTS